MVVDLDFFQIEGRIMKGYQHVKGKELDNLLMKLIALRDQGLSITQAAIEINKKRAHIAYSVHRYKIKNWKSPTRTAGRIDPKYFAKKVVRRNGYSLYVCERCDRKSTSRKFPVHHIDRNRENNSIENLEVLCPTCHAREHTFERTYAV